MQHQKHPVAWVAAIASFAFTLLVNADRIAKFFGILNIPNDARNLMNALAQVPTQLAWGIFIVGLGCLAYLYSDALRAVGGLVVRRLRVEPSHIIILGLTIALGGAIWGHLRMQQAPVLSEEEIAKIAAPFRTEIDALKKELAEARQQPSATPLNQAQATPRPVPAAPAYTERDIRELSDAFADAQQLVEKQFLPLSIEIETIVANWHGYIPNQGVAGYARTLQGLRERLQTDLWKPLNEFVYEKNPHYTDLMRTAFLLDDEAAKGELTRSLQTLIEAVQRLPDNPSEKTKELIVPQIQETSRRSNIVYNWIVRIKNRVASIRTNLRTQGVTGFEKSN
jgi:hypothetical protein